MLKELGYQPVYLDAPTELSAADLPSSDFSSANDATRTDKRMLSWWLFSNQKPRPPQHYSPDPGLALIQAAVDREGPFDGIVGFSQGSGFSAIVCSAIEQGQIRGQPKLKFAILNSGFLPNNKEIKARFFQQQIKVKSLHVISDVDPVVKAAKSMELSERFDNKSYVKHGNGHVVPADAAELDQIRKFVVSATSSKL